MLTTDSVFAPELLAVFLSAAKQRATADGVLALSTFVEDEKPLWARVDDSGRISALGPAAEASGAVTAGFYVFAPTIFSEIAAARTKHFAALRQFLGHLVERGYTIYGETVGQTVDVDRPEDIAVAESFVRQGFRI